MYFSLGEGRFLTHADFACSALQKQNGHYDCATGLFNNGVIMAQVYARFLCNTRQTGLPDFVVYMYTEYLDIYVYCSLPESINSISIDAQKILRKSKASMRYNYFSQMQEEVPSWRRAIINIKINRIRLLEYHWPYFDFGFFAAFSYCALERAGLMSLIATPSNSESVSSSPDSYQTYNILC